MEITFKLNDEDVQRVVTATGKSSDYADTDAAYIEAVLKLMIERAVLQYETKQFQEGFSPPRFEE